MNRKHTIFTLILLAICYAASFAQAPNQIRQRCPAPDGSRFATVNVSAAGNVETDPCPNKITGIVGTLKTYEPAYVSPFFPTAVSRITAGSNVTQTIPTANEYVGVDLTHDLTVSNTTLKRFLGIGNFMRMRGTPSGTTDVYGIFTDLGSSWTGAPLREVYAGYFNTDIGAASVTNLAGVSGTARVGSVNAGNITNQYGVRGVAAWGYASVSTNVQGVQGLVQGVQGGFGGSATNVRVVHATRANIDAAVTNFCWLCAGGGTTGSVTGTITNNYGLLIDSSVDQGTNRYSIFSTSVAPSVLAGDIVISDNTKGIILRSPDGTCYRFTVANGGALSAGASVTCP